MTSTTHQETIAKTVELSGGNPRAFKANRIAVCRQMLNWFLKESGMDPEKAKESALPYLVEKMSLERDEILGG